MRFPLLAFLACVTSVSAQQETEVPAAELEPATIAGEVSAERISREEFTSDWPALAAGSDGSLWAAYVEWDGKDSDTVVVRRRDPHGSWSDPAILDDGNWDHYLPAIAAVPDGAMAFWSGRDEGDFDVFGAHVGLDGTVGPVRRIASGSHGDFHVRAAATANGEVTVVWQSFRDLQSDIFARRKTEQGWGPVVRVSDSSANDWEPAVALDSTGTAWISWDSYHAGNYDVMLAAFDGREAATPIAITSGPATEFHSSIAVDSEDRVWVAYDTALENWGKDMSTSSSMRGSEGLHAPQGPGAEGVCERARLRTGP